MLLYERVKLNEVKNVLVGKVIERGKVADKDGEKI